MPDSRSTESSRSARRGTPAQAADLEAARGATRRGREAERRERRTSPELAVSVVGQLFRLAPRLVDVLDLGARDYGLGVARGRVLWALLESGPVVMRALSEALRISPRTVTGLIDALEADGWVTRSPHPEDRRATVISLTAASEQVLPQLRDSYEGMARDLLGDLSPADLARCHEVIGILEDRLDAVVSRRIAAYHGTAEADSAPGPADAAQAGRRARS